MDILEGVSKRGSFYVFGKFSKCLKVFCLLNMRQVLFLILFLFLLSSALGFQTTPQVPPNPPVSHFILPLHPSPNLDPSQPHIIFKDHNKYQIFE